MIISCVGWIALAWAAFLGARALAKMLPGSPPWLGQVAVKALMLAFALGMMKFSGRPWPEFGWSAAPKGSWKRAVLIGAALGASSTLLILLLGGKGLSGMLRGYSFPAIVLTVWLWSSFTEEVFTRGWLQTSLPVWRIALSGLFFGSIHVTVIWAGADTISGLVIVGATLLLGLWCARLRDMHASLWPALWAHIAFNIGGICGGVVYSIVHVIRFGKPPSIG